MSLNIKGTNFTLDAEMRAKIEEKMQGLNKYFDRITSASTEIEVSTRHHQKGDIYRAEIQLDVPGTVLRSEVSGESWNSAFSEAYKDVKLQLTKYKDKMRQ